MLAVVTEQRPSQLEEVIDAVVGDPVVDRSVLPARGDKSAPAQTGQVIRDLRLRRAYQRNQFADGRLPTNTQLVEDAKARGVAERAEVFGHEV